MYLWSVGNLLHKLLDWLSVLVRKNGLVPMTSHINQELELAAVTNALTDHEVCNITPIGVSTTIFLLAPSVYFLATASSSSSRPSDNPTSNGSASRDNEEVDNHFRQSLF